MIITFNTKLLLWNNYLKFITSKKYNYKIKKFGGTGNNINTYAIVNWNMQPVVL